ncbi:MAG: hypothetical protein B6U85_04420 [Desulfurococcales archaeon ex4484_42]|nr:MAG: hypothetical protein B6U85_04420 [Desulfurococcales archaeon ex4484_42]
MGMCFTRMHHGLILSITILLILQAMGNAVNAVNTYGQMIEYTLYLIDYGYIVVATDEIAYFEMPLNYSDGTLNQTVIIVNIGGNSYINRSGNDVIISLKMYNLTDAFMVAKIHAKMINFTEVLTEIMNNPDMFKNAYVIPSDILREFVKTPVKIVDDIVVKDFERWFKERTGRNVSTVSKAYLALSAAYFIYKSGYIKYSPSALPRTIEDIINSRSGDCDDMSRVLMNLLWHYGIPAKIEYGYVYLPLYLPVPVENSIMYFKNAGPHGYVVAYIPPLGWVSLDLLAGARLIYPVVVTGYDTTPDVSVEGIEEAKRFNKVNIYSELIELIDVNELNKLGINVTDDSSIREYALKILEESIKDQISKYIVSPQTITHTHTKIKTVILNRTVTERIEERITETLTMTSIKTKVMTSEVTYTVTDTLTTTVTYTLTKTLTKEIVPSHVWYSIIALVAIIIALALITIKYCRK